MSPDLKKYLDDAAMRIEAEAIIAGIDADLARGSIAQQLWDNGCLSERLFIYLAVCSANGQLYRDQFRLVQAGWLSLLGGVGDDGKFVEYGQPDPDIDAKKYLSIVQVLADSGDQAESLPQPGDKAAALRAIARVEAVCARLAKLGKSMQESHTVAVARLMCGRDVPIRELQENLADYSNYAAPGAQVRAACALIVDRHWL